MVPVRNFLSFYSTTQRVLNILPKSFTPSGCKSAGSCDGRIWIHYLPAQGYIRLSSPKQWILEMARASATQSQALTMFEVKLKIQPLSRSQTRQATKADDYRGQSGRDVQTCTARHNIVHNIASFSCWLLLPFLVFPGISHHFLAILHSSWKNFY